MRDRLLEALKRNTADYADIRTESEEATALAFRGREVERSSRTSHAGGVARACHKGGWGVVTFDSLDDLGTKVEEACRCAALVGRETTQLADMPAIDVQHRAVLKRDFRGVSVDEKLALIRGYNEIVLGCSPKVESTNVSYSDTFRTVSFASSRGTFSMEERPRVLCVLSGTARDGQLVQRAHESISSNTDYGAVLGLEPLAQTVGQRAAALLTAPKVEGGARTVILDPALAGVFIHEAFGHLSEADFVYENPQMRELMHVGREIGAKELNVYDDGTLPGKGGSLRVDDEGTPSTRTCLIREGVLAGHLHSLETAAKMGARPTGNARAISRHFAPIVRMTNTYIDRGSVPRADLFRGVEDGILACDMFGGQTMLEMFTFSAAYGYRIRNGQVGELVRDVVLTGNVFGTLKSIDAIADDLVIGDRAGGCGKGGQSPLPVSFGSPHIRIRNCVIGGK